MITGPGRATLFGLQAMTITVETGSGDNASANSYVSVADFKAYADARRLLSRHRSGMREAPDQGDGLHRGAAQPVSGHPVKHTQPLQWPRYGVSIDGYWIP